MRSELKRAARDRVSVVSGSSHPHFAQALAKSLRVHLAQTRIRTFSDGAMEVRILDDLIGHDVVIVQSGQAKPDNYLLEVMFLIDAAFRAMASSVTLVIPYLMYGRGDKLDEPGTAVRAKVVADMLSVEKTRIITMDLHAAQVQGFFRNPPLVLSAVPVLSAEIDNMIRAGIVHDPIFVAPDTGAIKLAQRFAKATTGSEANVAVGNKKRPALDEKSQVSQVFGEVVRRDTVIVDDIILTGGTPCNMADALVAEGARSVWAVATHGLFTPDAVSRIAASELQEVIVTDTVALESELGSRIRQVSVVPPFSRALRSMLKLDD